MNSKKASVARFMKPSAAAKYLGITLERLEELHTQGQGPKRVQKLGSVYYEIRDLRHYLEKQRRVCTNALRQSEPKHLLEILFDG